MGSMVEFFAGAPTMTNEALFRLYITGDTLMCDELQQIPLQYPVIDHALLHTIPSIAACLMGLSGNTGPRKSCSKLSHACSPP